MGKIVIIIVAIIILLGGIFYYWTRQSSNLSPKATIVPPVQVTTPDQSNSSNTDITNSISTQPQTDGDVLTIDSVNLTKPGFVVIHKSTKEGTVGAVVGYSELLPAGSHTSLDIDISPVAKIGDMYEAMLHEDTNNNKKFDAGTDMELMDNGKKVSTTFKVTASDSDAINTTPEE
jgi:hypothetical protein